jgi:hypothetical protein
VSIDPNRSSRFQSQFLVYRASAPLREKYSLPRAYVVLPDPLIHLYWGYALIRSNLQSRTGEL